MTWLELVRYGCKALLTGIWATQVQQAKVTRIIYAKDRLAILPTLAILLPDS